MSLITQIIFIVLFFLMCYTANRGFLSGLITYQLNKNAYKKRKKNQTFFEWLFLSRFKKEVPLSFRFFNVFFCVIHLLAIVACIILRIADQELSRESGKVIVASVMGFNAILGTILLLITWSKKPEVPYGRFVTRRNGGKRSK